MLHAKHILCEAPYADRLEVIGTPRKALNSNLRFLKKTAGEDVFTADRVGALPETRGPALAHASLHKTLKSDLTGCANTILVLRLFILVVSELK